MGVGSSAIVLMALLISGFIFNIIFHPFRYFSARAEGQKLFFMAAGTGLLLGAFVFFVLGNIRGLLSSESLLMSVAGRINGAIPIPHASRLLATMICSIGMAAMLNLISVRLVGGKRPPPTPGTGMARRTRAQCVYDQLTAQYGSSMAQLLRRAADEQRLVMFTLKSRKIYCGRVFEMPPHIDALDACIELLPSFSTYRDKDHLRMGQERTNYPAIEIWVARQRLYSVEEKLKLFERYVNRRIPLTLSATKDGQKFIRRVRRGLERQIDEAKQVLNRISTGRDFNVFDWIKVIPVGEIESISFYDPDSYSTWFSHESPPNPTMAAN